MEHSLWNASTCSAIKKFPAFYGTCQFITLFIWAHHCSMSSARLIYSMPYIPIYLTFILLFSFHLQSCLQNSLFPSGYSFKTFYAPVVSPVHAYTPPSSPWFDHVNNIWQRTYTNYEAPHCSVVSSLPLLLPPPLIQIFVSTPCSQTFSVHALSLMWNNKYINYLITVLYVSIISF